MNDPCFTLVANRHPGPCWYCGKRVKRGEGSLWREVRKSGAWVVGHSDCVAEAIADGNGPQVAEHGGPGSRAAREAELRGRLEAGLPVPDAGPRPAAEVLRRVREVMRVVRLDAPGDVLNAALAEVRAAVLGEDAVPF
jgi:hypothetical protein